MLAPSYLNLDPTKLNLLRRQWERDAKRRNDELKKVIAVLLLSMWGEKFNLDQFLYSLNNYFAKAFLAGGGIDRYWFNTYIQQAYRSGALNAYAQVHPSKGKKFQASEAGAASTFLMMILQKQHQQDQLDRFIVQTQKSLESIGAQLQSTAAQIITHALTTDATPAATAKILRNWIATTIPKRLVLTIEYQITAAHAEGQLDGFESLGITEVGADVEFVTVAGPGATEAEMIKLRVCPKCRALAGQTYTLQEARGVIPQHPKCRCNWLAIT